MIEKESYARAIGYGAMLTEGFVAVIALIAASVLIPGDYFAINSKLSFLELANFGFPVAKIQRTFLNDRGKLRRKARGSSFLSSWDDLYLFLSSLLKTPHGLLVSVCPDV